MFQDLIHRVGRTGPLTLLIVMGVLWGLQFAMLRQAAQGGYSDLTVLMIALILLSIVFSIIAAAGGERVRFSARLVVFLLVTAVLGYVVPLLAALYAANEISAGILSMIASLAPVVAVSVALLLRTERVSRLRVVAVGLGMLSVVLILLPELELPGRGKTLWMLVALAVPACYGIESVFIARYWPPGLSPIQAVTGETVVAAILVAPVFVLSGERLPVSPAWSDAEIAIVVFVAAGVVESLLYFWLIRTTGGVFVNFGTFVSLFAGIAWGMLLFSESHSLLVWFALAFLVAALFLAGREKADVT